ncbi:MAG TPA: PAS domain-containing protein [Rhodanobacteraceae bacterium]|nr:PAS domain-containing protein [Rhodanobacteraceae bacterium]
MAKRPRQFGIVEAIPGARASLRWAGWAGVALLVVPAASLAVLAASGAGDSGSVAFAWGLSLAGLLALAAAGYGMVRILSSLRRIAELTQVLSERGGGPVFVKDTLHRYRFANDETAALVGRHPVDILGRRDSELDPGSVSLAFEENDQVCLERDLPTLFRESQKTLDGERAFLVGKYPLHDARGGISGLVGVARDITEELELRKLSRRRADETRIWFDLNPLPVVTFTGPDLQVVNANAAALQCYGYDRAKMLRLRLTDLFATEEAGRLQAYVHREGRVIPPGSLAWKHRKASGEAFAVLTDMGNLPHEAVPAHVMMVRDISDLQAARDAAQAAEARYEDLVESGLAMVWMTDLDGQLLHLNTAMADALGHERDSMIGRPLSDFLSEETQAEWNDYLDRIHSLPRDAGLLHFTSRNGERRVWQYQFVCYPDAEPVPYVLVAAQDVTMRHRYESRIRDQNRRDPLTGCHTRRYLDAFAMQTTVNQVWGCVVVDVDYFRQLNASEGRARGDEILRDLARLLANQAGPAAEVVRMGGDEFAVVMPQADADVVRELAGRLAVASQDGMPAVFSLGWAVREAGEPLESTLRRADKALLRSRAQERG